MENQLSNSHRINKNKKIANKTKAKSFALKKLFYFLGCVKGQYQLTSDNCTSIAYQRENSACFENMHPPPHKRVDLTCVGFTSL